MGWSHVSADNFNKANFFLWKAKNTDRNSVNMSKRHTNTKQRYNTCERLVSVKIMDIPLF